MGEPCDQAMMELFQAELDTHLPVLAEGLLALEKDAQQPKRLEAMMRAAHSIKGAARIVGVEPAVRVAHVLEDCLVAAQKGVISLDAEAIDVLLRGVDRLTHVCRPAADAGAEGPDLEALVQAIAAVQQGRKPPARPPDTAPVPAPVEVAVVEVDNLDTQGGEQLRRLLLQRRRVGATRFLLDFSAVRDVDPAALALLALFARPRAEDGSPPLLEVVNAAPEVRDLFRLTRLDASYTLLAAEEG